ncbi:MAG TPA: hypothetical protein DC049_11845 [Spirochaetia bacterium]|nr:hypothetical protein [Spirochaetia bacterium]
MKKSKNLIIKYFICFKMSRDLIANSPHNQAQGNPFRNYPFAKLAEELHSSVLQKRGRRAFEFAEIIQTRKEFGRDLYPDVVKAFELRILELLKNRHIDEAIHYHKWLAEKNPEYRQYHDSNFLIEMDLLSGSCETISRYNSEHAVAEKIDHFILRNIKDLRFFANKEKLNSNNILKKHSQLLLNAWQEVETKNYTNNFFSMMTGEISRKSPFIYWRLLVQGIRAYYEQKNSDALLFLSKIDNISPLKNIASALADILSGAKDNKVLPKKIHECTMPDAAYPALIKISEIISKGKNPQADSEIIKLLDSPCLAGKNLLKTEILKKYFYLLKINCEKPPGKFSRYSFLFPAFLQAKKLLNNDSVDRWSEYLEKNHSSLSGMERALIYNRMGEIVFLSSEDDQEDDFMSAFLGFDRDNMKDSLKEAAGYWEKSLKEHPIRETFKVYYEETRKIAGEKKTLKILEMWHKAFPMDDFPITGLVNLNRQKKLFKKAMGYFSKLQKIEKGKPELEITRNYILVDNAVQYLEKKEPEKMLECLERVSADPDPFIGIIKSVLKWLAAGSEIFSNTSCDEHEKKIVSLEKPASIAYILGVLSQNWKIRQVPLPAKIKEQMKNIDMYVNDIHNMTFIRDPLWRIGDFKILPFRQDYFYQTKTTAQILIRCYEYFLCFYKTNNDKQIEKLLWEITGNGILRESENCGRFLLYRAVLLYENILRYGKTPGDPPFALYRRVFDCLAAAYYFARYERNDTEEISFFRQTTHFFLQEIESQVKYSVEEKCLKMKKKFLVKTIKTEGGNKTGPKTNPKFNLFDKNIESIIHDILENK